MCGIVGLFLKTAAYREELGRLTAVMLHEMRERGPDSAGFAVYDQGDSERTRITVLVKDESINRPGTANALEAALGAEVTLREIHDHAVFETTGDGRAARQWLIDNVAGVDVLSYGQQIELYKSVGDPDLVATRYDLASRSGTHAMAHTRMATESAVTTNGSHPFVTGGRHVLGPQRLAVEPQPTFENGWSSEASRSRPRMTPKLLPATSPGNYAQATPSTVRSPAR